MTLKFFALSPATVFKARVAQSSFTYPISSVTFDGVTVGSYADIEHGLTVLFGTTDGGDDLGRQRTGPLDATASVLYFGRCSEGTNDGEVSLQNDAYITVLNDFRVWSKTPYIDPATGVQYKDGSLTVGVKTTTPPPVANAGIPAAGTIDGVSGVLRVRVPSGSQTSFATAAGATITVYAWELPAGVTLVAGYALTDSFIEIDCDPGHHYITLTVTDSNGQTHQARTFIVADDPDASLYIPGVTVQSHRRTMEGQTLTVRLTQALDPATYPDGTLVMLVDGEPANSADRTNVLFWGWHQADPAQIQARRTGLVRYTDMTCVDVQGRLATLPGFPQAVENDLVRDTTKFPTITWSHMVGLTLDLYLHYLLYWHSTAFELTDYFPTLSTTIYSIGGAIESDGGSLWEQVKSRVKAFVPSKSIGCDLYGRLLIRADPMEEEPGVRTGNVIAALTAGDISDIRFTHTRSPGIHWLRGNAIQAISPLPAGDDGETYQPTFFCIAPGDVPGQGETEETFGEHLSPSQALLNTATGHHYARINAREGLFDITLVGADWQHLDPASMEWVTITLDAAYAAQRGLSFTAARGLLHEVNCGYSASATGTVRTCRITWERETVGRPAITVTQPDVEPVDDGNDDWYVEPVIPVAPPEDLYAGVEDVALLSADGYLFVTPDFQTVSGSGGPTYAKTDLSTGALYTWVVDPFSPGYVLGTGAGIVNGWAVGQTAIYRITDIFGTPGATAVHTFAVANVAASFHWRTIHASFGRYFAEGSNPWLICISYYGATAGHTGTWATYSLDGGTTWATEVQVSAEYDTGLTAPLPIGLYTSPKTPGYALTAAAYATGSPAPADGYYTTDWGATWNRISGVPVEDPAEPTPYWGLWDRDTSTLLNTIAGPFIEYEQSVYCENSCNNISDEIDLVLAAPTTAVRVDIEGSFANARVDLGGTSGATGFNEICSEDTTPPSPLVKTGVVGFAFDTSASYSISWARTTGSEWPGNRDDLLGAGITNLDDFAYLRFKVQVTTSGDHKGTNYLRLAAKITEIELADGTIYTPPVTANGMIQPVDGHAGSIHLPWPSNDDELVAFFGALDRIAERKFRVMRSLTGTPVDVSPDDATRYYGVHRPGFGIRTYDPDRTYAAFAGVGNETSADAADDLYALFVSSDSGATWTTIDGPDAVGTPHASEIAFGADDPDVLFAFGTDGYIMYSSNFGVALDSRAGNLATINGGTAPAQLIGIAGGPVGP